MTDVATFSVFNTKGVLLVSVMLSFMLGHHVRSAEISHEPAAMTANSSSSTAEILSPVLAERGFVRIGDSWYRQDQESVLMVDLQSSWPGPLLNFGVYWRKYGALTHPRIAQCHVWNRLEIMGPDALEVSALTDPSSGLSDDDRRRQLQRLVLTYGLPWLEGLSRFDTARSFLAEPRNRPAFIAREARQELAGELPEN
jgi:hypothetical protein